MTREEYKAIIRPFLGDKRYHHSECVADAAERLAKRYGADAEKAWTAGILHDIMKEVPPEEMLKKMESFGIILTDIEKSSNKLWHAICGAGYIEHVLGIKDREIIDAVLYHTTARADMTLMDEILFIADYISDDRKFDGVEEMRVMAFEDLEATVLHGCEETIRDLAKRHLAIHPNTMGGFNWCVLRQQNR